MDRKERTRVSWEKLADKLSAQHLGARIPLSDDGQPDQDLIERIDNDLRQILKGHRPIALDNDVLLEMRAIQEGFAKSWCQS